MSKKLKWILGIAVVLLILFLVFGRKKDEGINVAVEAVGNKNVIETVNASGKIYPEVEVKVSPDISGEIVELNVMEGDSVKKGQVVARIFADLYADQQSQAAAIVSQQKYQVKHAEEQIAGLKSAMDQTEAAFKRQKQLLADKVISQSEFEIAQNAYLSAKANYSASLQNVSASKAGVQSAQASLNRASKDVGRATLIAPMDGVVSLLNVKKGERVVGTAQMAGTEMMRIADMGSIEVRVDVPENDIPKVSIGDTAIVNVDAYFNRTFKGIVYQIASSQNGAINASTLTTTTSNEVTNYKVYIRLLKSSYEDLIVPGKKQNFPFRPGMTATADIQTTRKNNILAVPINAVTTRTKTKDAEKPAAEVSFDQEGIAASDDDESEVVVFVIDSAGTSVKKRLVKTGIQDSKNIEITSGLKVGDKIVVEPYNVIFKDLNDGSKVKVVDKKDLFKTTGKK